MKDHSIENKIKTAIDHSVPDVLDRILSECEQAPPHFIPINAARNTKRKRSWATTAGATAAALVIFAAAAFGVIQRNAYNTVASVVSLDVNPCIELKINKSDKILEANAMNNDALIILDGMNLRDVDIDVAINALIGSMVKNGYIDEYKNSILISVENKDTTKGGDLQNRITDEINKLLGTKSINGAILSQSVSYDTELRLLAEEHQISLGKAILIQTIIEKAPLLKFEDLAVLSINELNLLAESKKADLNNITTIGAASDKAYIGEEEAIPIALAHAKVSTKSASFISVELDVEDGQMVYEVDFIADGKEYEYEINAVSGAVVKYEVERDSHKPKTNDSDHEHDDDDD